ncbi:Bax inhibitor-1/YccA family protein [Desulfobacterales bacterium HSG16]|nr:Bax inhibitor-1/YccA family protein [Desulfobacterales bacterium HSG16]
MVNSFIRSVYNWMAVGLALTGGIALFASQSAFLKNLIFGNRFMFYGLIIGELGMVFFLSARISKIKASTATALFLGYAALNGLTLSFVFLVYTSSSIASTFFICAGMFAGLSIYGMVTKRDLTSVGNFMMMGLFGIILASVVNIFMQSHFIHMLIAYAGVLIFTGLTAYDTQKIKEMAISQPAGLGEGVARKGAIMGALTLYLDFINLFLMLLRIFGDSD